MNAQLTALNSHTNDAAGCVKADDLRSIGAYILFDAPSHYILGVNILININYLEVDNARETVMLMYDRNVMK